MSIKIEKMVEQATIDGKFDKQKFAELIVGKCVRAVIKLEMSKSDFIAAIIEEEMGLEQGHFTDEWFKENYKFL
jgi:hypothetical protein